MCVCVRLMHAWRELQQQLDFARSDQHAAAKRATDLSKAPLDDICIYVVKSKSAPRFSVE